MCLAVPALILEVRPNGMGVVDHAGNQREISLLLIDEPRVGEYVILHAGFALSKIDEAAARETMEYLELMATQLPPDYDPNLEM